MNKASLRVLEVVLEVVSDVLVVLEVPHRAVLARNIVPNTGCSEHLFRPSVSEPL